MVLLRGQLLPEIMLKETPEVFTSKSRKRLPYDLYSFFVQLLTQLKNRPFKIKFDKIFNC